MDKFDIICTATLRPELLSHTLSSFHKNLFRENIKSARLILNIDCAGAPEKYQEQKISNIISIVGNFKFRNVIHRVNDKPCFPEAFFWCLDKVESKYFFNLEEDWILKIPLDFEEMFYLMERDKKIAHLRLSSFKSTESDCKNWNKFLKWNGHFFEVEKEDKCIIGWAGHPSLNKTQFLKDCAKFCDKKLNHEKQIKGRRYKHPINKLIENHRFGSFHLQNSRSAIEDIGRDWMINNGYIKEGNKAFFTRWKKIEGK